MIIKQTKDIASDDGIVMVVYGQPKTGKTSFAASTSKFGKTLIFDFDNGSKYLGERGLFCDVAPMSDWFKETTGEIRNIIADYEFIVVDTVGESMEFLINGGAITGTKYRQRDGSLSIAGWGEAKKRLSYFIKFLKSTGKTILLIFHDDRYKYENELYHSLMVATKLKESIPGIVDIISYLAVIERDGETKRVLYTPAKGKNYDSGDRTGRVPEIIEISEDNGWKDFIGALKPKIIIKPEEEVIHEETGVTSEAENSLLESEKELDNALTGTVENGEE